MKFIDLFAGLGGFHLALANLGYDCVFACEIDGALRELYQKNLQIECAGDIRGVPVEKIPPHDILCAGFPCQPFSKAGNQAGFDDPESGDLFSHIMNIISHHQPSYVILENVPNILKHDGGKTWEKIESSLRSEGYDIRSAKISPHNYGIPQIRERLYIIGSHDSLENYKWPKHTTSKSDVSIRQILEVNPIDAQPIPEQVQQCLDVWQEFLDQYPKNEKLPSFPIWSMEFGATYPFEEKSPSQISTRDLIGYYGSHGRALTGETREELLKLLPTYAITRNNSFPLWKVRFIRQNRELYHHNKRWIDKWKHKIMEFPVSFQKFEWNCQGGIRKLHEYVLQIRASGVRVKYPTTSPSLVAMTATQVPIITWEGRYITPKECQKLQNMEALKWIPENRTKAYEAFGNAVNVKVVELVAEGLLHAPDTSDASDISFDLLPRKIHI